MKVRLLFEKKGTARYISHLDLSRVFTRAVGRGDLPIKYTEGFNPHPYLVFGQPLPLGFLSEDEILDFELTRDMGYDEIVNRLSGLKSIGIVAKCAYEPVGKLKEIEYAIYEISLEDAKGEAYDKLQEFFDEPSISIIKKSKRGEREIDLKDFIKNLSLEKTPEAIKISLTLPCSSTETLNPTYVLEAFKSRYAGEFYTQIKRIRFLNKDFSPFI